MHPAHIDHVPELLARFDNKPASLVPILEAIVDEYTYLPEDAVRQVAVKLQIPVAEVLRVAQTLADPNRAPQTIDV